MGERSLKRVDALFGAVPAATAPPASANQIHMISHESIDEHPGHRLRPYDKAMMERVTESIREYGVLQLVLLRPKAGGRYTMNVSY